MGLSLHPLRTREHDHATRQCLGVPSYHASDPVRARERSNPPAHKANVAMTWASGAEGVPRIVRRLFSFALALSLLTTNAQWDYKIQKEKTLHMILRMRGETERQNARHQ